MSIAYLALGSNLEDRRKNINQAIERLRKEGITPLKHSTIIETEPEGGPINQGKFLNSVLKVETSLSPESLLSTIQRIEKQLGRVRTIKNGPRTIDIDILLFDNITHQSTSLTIPHPRMYQRNFVLTPLKEIAPELGLTNHHAHL